MAKRIKFYLILDKESVKTIEEIRENFCIQDILEYYKNGLLLRFLEVRGYNEEFEKVKNIDKNLKDLEILKSLIDIFKIENLDVKNVEKDLEIIAYKEEKIIKYNKYSENKFKVNEIIKNYHLEYCKVIENIIETKDNMSILKANALKIEKTFFRLFDLDHKALFEYLCKNAPKSIFAILTLEKLREKWIGENADEKIYKFIREVLLTPKNLKETMEEDIKIVNKNTQGMWDNIEKTNVKIMPLSISKLSFVKEFEEFEKKLSSEDINKSLPILNGLSYQCNGENKELIYMEV